MQSRESICRKFCPLGTHQQQRGGSCQHSAVCASGRLQCHTLQPFLFLSLPVTVPLLPSPSSCTCGRKKGGPVYIAFVPKPCRVFHWGSVIARCTCAHTFAPQDIHIQLLCSFRFVAAMRGMRLFVSLMRPSFPRHAPPPSLTQLSQIVINGLQQSSMQALQLAERVSANGKRKYESQSSGRSLRVTNLPNMTLTSCHACMRAPDSQQINVKHVACLRGDRF
jgi:hypothetical protein